MSVLDRKLFSCGGQVKKYKDGGAVFYSVSPDLSIKEVDNAITPDGQRSFVESSQELMDVGGPEGRFRDDGFGKGIGAEGYDERTGKELELDLLSSGVMGLLDKEDATTVEGAINAETPITLQKQDEEAQQEIISAAHDPDALRTTIAQKTSDKSGGAVTPDQVGTVIDETSEKYSALGGDPSTFLLDFGLALMASKSPYFMTAVGEAGLVARKSAKERNKERREDKKLKLEEDLLGYKIKKLKEEDTSGMYKSILGKMDKLTPTSQDLVQKAMSNKLSPSAIYPMMEYAEDTKLTTMSYIHPETGDRVTGQVRRNDTTGALDVMNPDGSRKYSVDPEGAVGIGMQSPVAVDETGFTQPQQKVKMELDQKFDGTVQFLGSSLEYLNLFHTTEPVLQPIMREGLLTLEGLKQGVSTLARSLGYGSGPDGKKAITDDLAKKLENPAAYLDQYFGRFETLSPEMKSYAERLGGWEAFKARGLSLAISLAAADGATGKALSDKDMQQYLTQIGMGAQTKEGFTQTLESLIQKKKDDYIVSLMGFHRSTLPRDEYNRMNFTTNYADSGKGFWDYEFSQPAYKELYGGRLYSQAPSSPNQTVPIGGSAGGNPFDPFVR